MSSQSLKTVVVVNDDPTQLGLLSGFLEREGLDVQAFGDVERTLEYLTTHRMPELIITDLYMPQIDGWRFCRLLRSPEYPAFHATPIMVISATYTGDHMRGITAELGANAFINSPFNPAELSETVKALLSGENPHSMPQLLVVETDAAEIRVLRDLFQGRGYEIHEAHTGAEARALAGRRSFDLILLDHQLPDASGEELLAHFRQRNPRALVVILTPEPTPDNSVRLLKSGAAAYVRQPVDAAYLGALCASMARAQALVAIEDMLEARTRDLRSSEQRYRSLFNEMVSGFALFDIQRDSSGRPVNWLLLEANAAFEKLVQAPRASLVGRAFEQVFEGATPVWRGYFENAVLHGASAHFELEFPNAEKCYEIAVFSPSADQLAITVQDITEHKRSAQQRAKMERQLQEAQRLESLGVLAEGIAHDFNNILTAVLGNTSLAQLEMPAGHAVQSYLEQIEKASHRASDLCKQMLAYAGRGRFLVRTINLSQLVEQTQALLMSSTSKKAEVHFQLDPHLPMVEADPTQMRQILVNLVTNASEALSEESGSITISTGSRRIDGGFLASHFLHGEVREGNFVFLEVSDSGAGMKPEVQSRIFEPFFTTKFPGRGLGLPAALGIVRSHQGAIHVQSTPGQGSVFQIFLPAGKPAAPPPGEPKPAKRTTILVADDEPTVSGLARKVLEKNGFSVLTASHGMEAVDAFSKRSGEIDLVILDLNMPKLSGTEVFTEIRRLAPWVPVMLMSGYGEDSAVSHFDEAQLAGFLQKPFKPDELLAKVIGILKQRASQGHGAAGGAG